MIYFNLDPGLTLTGLAVAIAVLWGRDWRLRGLLLASWAVTTALVMVGADMATVVFSATTADFAIALSCLVIGTLHPDRFDARTIGGISICLMPMHWLVALNQGLDTWLLYAYIVNAAFVLQCAIVRGWLDGLGRGIGDLLPWLRRVHLLRGWGR